MLRISPFGGLSEQEVDRANRMYGIGNLRLIARNPQRSGGSRRGSVESGGAVEKPEKQARLVLRFSNSRAGFERFL